jgi:hypothetical protein
MLGSLATRERRPLWGWLSFLLILGIGFSLVMAGRARSSAIAEVALDAELTAQTELAPLLEPRDLVSPIVGERATDLGNEIDASILSVSRIDAVRIYSSIGRILYADDPAIVGTRPSYLRDLTFQVANGDARSAVRGGMVQTFVPIWLVPDGTVVVAEMSQVLGPVASKTTAPWYRVALALTALLFASLAMFVVTSLARPMTMPVQVYHPTGGARLGKGGHETPLYEHPGFRAIEEQRQSAEERARTAEEDLKDVQVQLKDALAEIRTLEGRLTVDESQTTTNDSELQALRDQLRDTAERLHKADLDNNALRERLALRQQELEKARHQIATAAPEDEDVDELQRRLDAAENKAAAMTREMEKIEADLDYTTNKFHMTKLTEALREIDNDEEPEDEEDDLYEHPVIIRSKLSTPGKVR